MSWLAKLKQLKEVSLQEEGEVLQKLPSPPIPTLQKLQKEVLVVSVGSLLGTSENLGSDNSSWSAVEIDTFICRRHKLTEKGLSLEDAEVVAETLLFRDREIDNRRLCLECVHLQGDKQQGWLCAKIRYAQGNKNGQPLLAVHPMNRQGMVLPMEYVYQLQRCDSFQGAV
jgi:hypothetical protein